MNKSIFRNTGLVTLVSLLMACGGDNKDTPVPEPIPEVVAPDTPAPEAPIVAEITNGGFEEDTTGQATPVGNWVFRPDQESSATSTIEVIESQEGVNTYKGTKAAEVIVNTLGDNPWGIEIAYEDNLNYILNMLKTNSF